MPPVKDRLQDNLENIKCDSISAVTKDTRVYMLYETNRDHPAYVVKYQYKQCNYLKINDYVQYMFLD